MRMRLTGSAGHRHDGLFDLLLQPVARVGHRFNAAKPADKYFGTKWERLLPESEYIKRAGPD